MTQCVLINVEKNFNLFFISRSIPKYFLWLSYMSWFKYSNMALQINQWYGIQHIQCKETSFRCFRTGQNVLDFLSIDPVGFNYIQFETILLKNIKKNNNHLFLLYLYAIKNELSYAIYMHVYVIIGWRVLAFLVLLGNSYNL